MRVFLLNDDFLRILAQVWGCLILGLAVLRGFFFFDMRRLCFLVAVVNVHFHWTWGGVTSLGSSFLRLLFVDLWGWPVWRVDFDFPWWFWLVFWQQLGMLCIYSCGGGLLFFFSCFLYVKECEENLLWPLSSWNSIVFVIYFCKPHSGRFPESSYH